MRLIRGGVAADRPNLTPGARAWLAQNVEVRVLATVPNPAAPTLPPGGTDYRLEFVLPWLPEGPAARFPDLEAVLETVAGVTANAGAEPLEVDVVVGGTDVVVG